MSPTRTCTEVREPRQMRITRQQQNQRLPLPWVAENFFLHDRSMSCSRQSRTAYQNKLQRRYRAVLPPKLDAAANVKGLLHAVAAPRAVVNPQLRTMSLNSQGLKKAGPWILLKTNRFGSEAHSANGTFVGASTSGSLGRLCMDSNPTETFPPRFGDR